MSIGITSEGTLKKPFSPQSGSSPSSRYIPGLPTVPSNQGETKLYNQQIKIEYQNFGIKMGSVVYNQVAEFAKGDYVYFNFDFQFAKAINSTENECFNETSLTELSSLEQPEFDVVFSRIGLKPVPKQY